MERLKEISRRGHYLGLSEEIRSVVRKKWLEYGKIRNDSGISRGNFTRGK